jgi:hypothetical protein
MRLRRHLTYANVMATFAAFGVLAGGGAYAASLIDTSDIANKAVTAKKIDAHAVKGSKIAQAAVTTSALNLTDQGVAAMGASVRPDGSVRSFFNRLPAYLPQPSSFPSAAPTVWHKAPGSYTIDWPGAADLEVVGAIQVASVDSDEGGDADVTQIETSGGPEGWRISTRDILGNPADRGFSIVVFAPRVDRLACNLCSGAK